jgi:hypothetical protein
MKPRSVIVISRSNPAFSLLETLMMLVALMVFTLLLAGVTKPLWHDNSALQSETKGPSRTQTTSSSR